MGSNPISSTSGGDLNELIRNPQPERSGASPDASSILQPLLRYIAAGSTGFLLVGTAPNYAASLPHFGTSPTVLDVRATHMPGLQPPDSSGVTTRVSYSLTATEQIQEMLAVLALNKSQMVTILRVSRPTLYDWLAGKEPAANNAKRIDQICQLLNGVGIASNRPLNARFVRRPLAEHGTSIIEELTKETISEGDLGNLLRHALTLTEGAVAKRQEREDRLRGLGYDEPSEDGRRDNLGRNVALLDWPKS